MLETEFYPEGHRLNAPENLAAISSPAALSEAQRAGRILESRALMCDGAHNLIVDLGCMRGLIPREEGAYYSTQSEVGQRPSSPAGRPRSAVCAST